MVNKSSFLTSYRESTLSALEGQEERKSLAAAWRIFCEQITGRRITGRAPGADSAVPAGRRRMGGRRRPARISAVGYGTSENDPPLSAVGWYPPLESAIGLYEENVLPFTVIPL